uniref:EGF-like domain-containing protein n=1 Tax=Ascaris lumbricoides TaxID=6252 RepID=A0A0M3HV56_ASCLU
MNVLLTALILYLFISFHDCSVLCSLRNHTSNNSRTKRAIYYLCGVYPRQYYSTKQVHATPKSTIYSNVIACYYTEKKCENGGDMLGVGCTNQRQCALYHSGQTACINGCCCTVPNNATPSPNLQFGSTAKFTYPFFSGFVIARFCNLVYSNCKKELILLLGYCYNGQLSQVRCSAQGQCSPGQTCMNGLCCTTTREEYQHACGGVAALGTCRDGHCSDGGYCTTANLCCECPVGRSGGQCNQGICPNGFTCMPNGYCCASCPNDATPFGACREGVCGGGTSCSAGNICC